MPSAVIVARADMSFSSVGVARRAWAHATLKPPTFRMFAASRSVPWLATIVASTFPCALAVLASSACPYGA